MNEIPEPWFDRGRQESSFPNWLRYFVVGAGLIFVGLALLTLMTLISALWSAGMMWFIGVPTTVLWFCWIVYRVANIPYVKEKVECWCESL